MGELTFIGLGLFDEGGISIRGLKEMRKADSIFIELYTSLMPGLSINRLKLMAKKEITIVSREILEEGSGRPLLEAAKAGKAVLLVPGDPLIATTHVALLVQAKRMGLRTRIIHGASIVSAAMGLSGLHNYKFGRSVTIPFPDGGFLSETPYVVIEGNKRLGLHTLCFLDIRVDERRYMTIYDGLRILMELERRKGRAVITMDSLVVGIARAGSDDPVVKAGFLEDVLSYDFGGPPHTLIFPGDLHFTEAEALAVLAGAPKSIMRSIK